MSNSTSSNPSAIRVAARSGLPQAATQGAFQLLHGQAVAAGRRPSVAPRRPCPEDYRMSRAELVTAIRGLQSKGSLPKPYPLAAGKLDKLPAFVGREAIKGEPGFLQRLVSSVQSFHLGPAGAMATPIATDSADPTGSNEPGTLQSFLDDIDTSSFHVVSERALQQRQTTLRLGDVRVLIRLNRSNGAAAREMSRLLARHFEPSSSHTRLRVSCLAGMPQLPGQWVAEELYDPDIASELRVHDASWQVISSGFDEPARRLGLVKPDESWAGMGSRHLENLVRPWRHDVHGHDGPTNETPDERKQFAESVTIRACEHTRERNAILRKMGLVLYARLQEPAKADCAQVDIISMDDSNAMALEFLDLYGQTDLVMLLEHEKF